MIVVLFCDVGVFGDGEGKLNLISLYISVHEKLRILMNSYSKKFGVLLPTEFVPSFFR